MTGRSRAAAGPHLEAAHGIKAVLLQRWEACWCWELGGLAAAIKAIIHQRQALEVRQPAQRVGSRQRLHHGVQHLQRVAQHR